MSSEPWLVTVDLRKVTFCKNVEEGVTQKTCFAEKHSALLKLEVVKCFNGYSSCGNGCSHYDCACIFEQCNLNEAQILAHQGIQDFTLEAMSAALQYL